jgi:hypothetical protein
MKPFLNEMVCTKKGLKFYDFIINNKLDIIFYYSDRDNRQIKSIQVKTANCPL